MEVDEIVVENDMASRPYQCPQPDCPKVCICVLDGRLLIGRER